MTKIRMAEGVEFPSDVVTQKIAFIARSGMGKTYAATKLAEGMLQQHAQVVVLDPVGVWWGLRLMKDGKTPSPFTLPIFGGDHKDLPLDPHSGAFVARLVVETGISVVLDVSEMTQSELLRFGQDFAETFFQLKKGHRSPVHLFIEEAQFFIPQECPPEGKRMLGAFERLAKVGRNYGVGYTVISQRPQAVNKQVLNQVECLCCLQIAGAHERKALKAWVVEKEVDQSVDELPKLSKGEVLVWSPQWLRQFIRTKFEPKLTYDASATPDWSSDKKQERRELPSIDIEEIRTQMAEVIEEQKANDPKALRRRVRELEVALEKKGDSEEAKAELRHLKVLLQRDQCLFEEWQSLLGFSEVQMLGSEDGPKVFSRVLTERLRRPPEQVPMITPEDLARFEAVGVQMADGYEAANKLLQGVHARIHALKATWPVGETHDIPKRDDMPTTRVYEIGKDKPSSFGMRRSRDEGATSLRAGARRMLAAIAQFPKGIEVDQVAMLSDLRPTSGTFSTYMGDLRRGGFIENRGRGVVVTAAGKAEARGLDVRCPRSEQEVLDLWKGKLRSGARRMFEIIVEHRSGITRSDLADRASISESSGTFSTYLGDIMRTGCFERVAGFIRVRTDLSELVAR